MINNKINNKKGIGQIGFVWSLVFIGLFSIAVIGFSLGFANDNNAPINLANDPEISNLYTELGDNTSALKSASQNTYQSIVDTTISPESGSAQSVAPFTLTVKNVINVITSIMNVGYKKIFGTDSGFGIFLTTFIAMLGFTSAFLIYKALRGIPD